MCQTCHSLHFFAKCFLWIVSSIDNLLQQGCLYCRCFFSLLYSVFPVFKKCCSKRCRNVSRGHWTLGLSALCYTWRILLKRGDWIDWKWVWIFVNSIPCSKKNSKLRWGRNHFFAAFITNWVLEQFHRGDFISSMKLLKFSDSVVFFCSFLDKVTPILTFI